MQGLELERLERQMELKYWAFARLIQKYSEDIPSHIEKNIESALNWFLLTYPKKPIEEPHFLYVRVLVFWSLRSLYTAIQQINPKPANTDDLNSIIEKCLDLQPLLDLLPTIVINVTDWLAAHDGKIVLLEDIMSYDVHKLFMETWDDLYIRPFTNPFPENMNQLIKLVKNRQSRSDVYAHIIKCINDNVRRIQILQHTLEAKNDIITNPNLKALKQKAEFYIQFMNDNLYKGPPSKLVLKPILAMISAVMDIYDPDPFSGLHDTAMQLQNTTMSLMEQMVRKDEPPALKFEAKEHPIFKLLAKKKTDAFEDSLSVGQESRPKQFISPAMSISSMDLAKTLVTGSDEEVYANLDDVWIEVDPVSNRIIIPSLEKELAQQGNHSSLNEVLAATNSGLLKITRTELQWYGIDRRHLTGANMQGLQSLRELAIQLPLKMIERFTIGVFHTEDALVSKVEATTHRLSIDLSISKKGNGAKRNQGANSSFSSTATKTKYYYLGVFTKDEVFRFFPFNEDEGQALKTILIKLTGRNTFLEADFVKDVLSKQLIVHRYEVLKVLLLEEAPWVDNSADLSELIASLTSEHYAQDMIDMERLFHSCRMESEVTKEVLSILKRYWEDVQSEPVKVKILTILNRLVDKNIMQKGDSVFRIVYKWIKYLEQTISPYSSPIAATMISDLSERCKLIMLEPLTPIVASHARSTFSLWEDYNFWLHIYKINTTGDLMDALNH